jgi:hypothetical protein
LEWRAKEWNVFRAIIAVALASAASLATAATSNILALDSHAPWWEKVTVTIGGDGQPQSCRFESSAKPDSAQACQVEASQAAVAKTATGSKDSYTRITFERRFTTEWQSASAQAPAGNMLLGQQVMSLSIGAKGVVEGCQIVSASGDMKPQYGCKEASAEKFQTGVRTGEPASRQAYMTILVYGHSEHVV